jgi:hypothetical protein
MKKILILAIVVFTAGLSAVAQNLVANGDFENWTPIVQGTQGDSLVMPDGWLRGAGAMGTNYQYATDPVQGNVLRLIDNVDPAKARRFNTTTNFSISTEGTYRVSFKVKGDVGLRFVALVKGTASPSSSSSSSAQGITNHFTNIAGYPSPTVVSDWTTVQTDIVVPSTATFGDDYRFHISWSHSTTTLFCDFLIDDISVAKLSDEGLNSITITPKDYTTATGTPNFGLYDFSPEKLNYVVTTSWFDVPVVDGIASRTGSQVSITQAASLTGPLADRKATIIVTTSDSKVTVYTVEFVKHPGFISGIPWDIRNNTPVEWGQMAGVYTRNTTTGTNHNKFPTFGNTSLRCNATSESGFYITTPVLEDGASTLSFYLKNTNIVDDETPVVVQKSDDENTEWVEIHRVTPNTSEWSNWKEVKVNINDNSPGLKIKFVFEKTITTSGTVYLDDVEIMPFVATSTNSIRTSDIRVYGFNNQLLIQSNESVPFIVYNINGMKISAGNTSEIKQINLNKGVYIVKAGNESFKVIL